MTGIDKAALQTMLEQMRSAVSNVGLPKVADSENNSVSTSGVEFGKALKQQLEELNQSQQKASQLGERFSLGDESVNLSDVMIASQKANIELQTAVQVRNKLVSAYHDIMNMQI